MIFLDTLKSSVQPSLICGFLHQPPQELYKGLFLKVFDFYSGSSFHKGMVARNLLLEG